MSTHKPRLRKADFYGRGRWLCSSEGGITGNGDTPEEAYEDWEYWNKVLEWDAFSPPKDSWLSADTIPNLVKKIKNWRGGKKDE